MLPQGALDILIALSLQKLVNQVRNCYNIMNNYLIDFY